jgi:hypothetical protein
MTLLFFCLSVYPSVSVCVSPFIFEAYKTALLSFFFFLEYLVL